MRYKYLKGPVYSRRLGKSLGINIITDKSCSFDCVYCEIAKTPSLTLERKEYIETNELINELDNYLKNEPELDFITFSSTGEPTLHIKIKEVIEFLKENYPKYKIALITNSSFLSDKNIRNEVANVDLIVPSLDAVSNNIFQKINRPHENLNIKEIIDGLINLGEEFQGEIWLEIFIIHGLNDNEKELNKFLKVINKLNVDKVQLNSLDRPAPEKWVRSVSKERLIEIKNYLSKSNVKIEII